MKLYKPRALMWDVFASVWLRLLDIVAEMYLGVYVHTQENSVNIGYPITAGSFGSSFPFAERSCFISFCQFLRFL